MISRTSTQHYKSAPKNLPEIAKQLGVAHILEGSVQKSGDAVRVNVQLIKAATDSHLWSDTFDRKLTDIFSVQSEVAKAIADQLRAKLTGQEQEVIAAKPTDNPEAYDAYLRGLAYTLKTGIHTGELPWRAEISQRSSAIGPEVRPWLGAALLRRCEWLSHTESSTNRRPPRRSAAGGRNGSYSTAQSWRGRIRQGFLPLRLPERL